MKQLLIISFSFTEYVVHTQYEISCNAYIEFIFKKSYKINSFAFPVNCFQHTTTLNKIQFTTKLPGNFKTIEYRCT